MFVDKVEVTVRAGNGGNGVVSFRHEKFIDRGGPDGGDGGDGGDVILVASNSQNTLAAFRYKRTLQAENGTAGSKQKKHGRNGDDLRVPVPVGTVVMGEDGKKTADLALDGQEAVIAFGGKGGFGNAHFTSSTRQAPRVAEKGEPGDASEITLELKLIADVGLVGLPNAGKSTFLAAVSNAHPEIADYPFTTLHPNLGVVDLNKDTTLLIADIPGLVEGASKGKGLGDEFLRHVERTSVLLHLIDVYNDDLVGAYKTIQNELAGYIVDLSKKPQIVALTKVEGLDDEMIEDRLKELRKVLPAKAPAVAISAVSGKEIKELINDLQKLVVKTRNKPASKKSAKDTLPVIYLTSDEDKWEVKRTAGGFVVSGKRIERFAQRTNFDSEPGVQRLRDILRKTGIMHELVRRGIKAGDRIHIGKTDNNTLTY